MGYFQELASRPENKAKRAAEAQARIDALETKVYATKEELIIAYAAEHNITEEHAAILIRQEWTGPVENAHYWKILDNPRSAYSAAWGRTIPA